MKQNLFFLIAVILTFLAYDMSTRHKLQAATPKSLPSERVKMSHKNCLVAQNAMKEDDPNLTTKKTECLALKQVVDALNQRTVSKSP